jgi:polar amino acid transport system substrate-binding protein
MLGGRHTIGMGTVAAATMLVMAGLLVIWPGAVLGNAGAAERQAASPTAIAKKILGHAPRGLAKTIVQRKKVLIANDLNYPPQSFIDPQAHKLVGFDVDVAKEAARILGLGVVWKHPAWATVFAGLKHGRFDVSIGSMTIMPARKRDVSFTGPYYFVQGQVFVKTAGTQISGPGDLAGKTVGVLEGTSYSDYLTTKTTAIVQTYNTDLDAVPDLVSGAIDFWMTDSVTGRLAVLEGKALEPSGKPLYKKGEADWLALLNYTVKKMHKDGSLSAMSEKWYYGLDLTVNQ